MENKINVLFIFIQMEMGGSEHLVLDLVRKLDRDIFNPHVAWLHKKQPLAEFIKLDIPLHYVPKVKRFDLDTMLKIGRLIKKHRIHVVNAHHFLSMVYCFYGAKIANNIKLIYTEHSEWEIDRISWKWLIAGRFLAKKTDAVVGISNKVRDHLQRTFQLPRNIVHSITNGVDCNICSISNDTYDYKHKYGLNNTSLVIGIVANLKKNKNHIFLLKSFKKLIQCHKDLKLMIIGHGSIGDPEGSEDEIRSFINTTNIGDNVLLMGGRPDVPDILKALDIFCLTSHKEGLPISLIEAMATGLPVVGTDVEGIQDVIIHGENGFLVPLSDVERLTHALHQLIQDQSMRKTMGLKSRWLACNFYNLDSCVKNYQSLFQNA